MSPAIVAAIERCFRLIGVVRWGTPRLCPVRVNGRCPRECAQTTVGAQAHMPYAGAMPLHGEYKPSASESARTQAEDYEASNGEKAGTLRGVPIIVLTTVGAKTGALRKTALMRVEHEGRYAVVASKGGAPDEPRWGENLRRHPHVELQDRADKSDYIARELSEDEREEWWRRAVEVWPAYDEYQTKTDRKIAVFVLESIRG